MVAFELERDQRELLGALVADQPELADVGDPLGQRAGVGLHHLHDVAVAVVAEAPPVVVLREHHQGSVEKFSVNVASVLPK